MGCTHLSTWETGGGDILNWRHTNSPVSLLKNVDGGIISNFPQREREQGVSPLFILFVWQSAVLVFIFRMIQAMRWETESDAGYIHEAY